MCGGKFIILKFNTFHWQLTEDQGWRIEIKKYPKLTQVGAYRKETLVGHYNDQPHQFDGKTKGERTELRRVLWTSRHNLTMWFETWEGQLIYLGFGRAWNKDIDEGDKVRVVLFPGQDFCIANFDETG